jgi:hypothetical protein
MLIKRSDIKNSCLLLDCVKRRDGWRTFTIGQPCTIGAVGTHLSSREQQMLAIGRALVLNPKLKSLSRVFREHGMPAIVVEQQAPIARPFLSRGLLAARVTVQRQKLTLRFSTLYLGLTKVQSRRTGPKAK